MRVWTLSSCASWKRLVLAGSIAKLIQGGRIHWCLSTQRCSNSSLWSGCPALKRLLHKMRGWRNALEERPLEKVPMLMGTGRWRTEKDLRTEQRGVWCSLFSFQLRKRHWIFIIEKLQRKSMTFLETSGCQWWNKLKLSKRKVELWDGERRESLTEETGCVKMRCT